jgi:hypothetical protein
MNEWIRGAGVIVETIWVVAGFGILLLVDRLYVVVARSGLNGRHFIETIIRLARAGKIDEAIKVCSRSRTILSDIALLILRARTREEVDLLNVAEAAELSLVPRLHRRLHYFGMLARISVLLGVIGLCDGYRIFYQSGGAALSPHPLGRGFLAIEAGLGVASVLVLAQGLLTARSTRVVEQVEELSARLVNALIDRPDVRLGHR